MISAVTIDLTCTDCMGETFPIAVSMTGMSRRFAWATVTGTVRGAELPAASVFCVEHEVSNNGEKTSSARLDIPTMLQRRKVIYEVPEVTATNLPSPTCQ